MTFDEIAEKAREGTVTIREVTTHLKSSAGMSKNKKKKLQTLLNSGFEKMGIDPDLPFSALSRGENVALFSIEGSPDGKNRLTSLQVLNEIGKTFTRRGINPKNDFGEPLYQDLEQVAKEDVKVKKFQTRGERPMEGLITQAEMKEIYDTNLQKVKPEIADALNFSRITGVRPAQITTGTPNEPNVNQITKDMVSITTNEAGEPTRVRIEGITGTKKNRPDIDVPADSSLGKLIIRSYERPGEYLFNVKQSAFDTAFRKNISPTLIAEHEKKLPLDNKGNRMSSSMVARAAFSKQLADEFKIGDLETEFMMGQKPKSVLRGNYAGRPDIATEDFYGLTSGDRVFDIDSETGERSQTARNKTPEEIEAESSANVAKQKERESKAKAAQLETDKKTVEYLSSPEGQDFLKKQHELELQQLKFDEDVETAKYETSQKRKQFRAALKAQEKVLSDDQAANIKPKPGRRRAAANRAADTVKQSETNPMMGHNQPPDEYKMGDEETKGFYNKLPKATKLVPFVGAAYAASIKKGEAEEAFERGDTLMGTLRSAQAVEEAISPLPFTTGDVEDFLAYNAAERERKAPQMEQLMEQRAGRMKARRERATSSQDEQMDELLQQQE